MRILVIPHTAKGAYKLRELELARAMATNTEVYYLDFSLPDASSANGWIRVVKRHAHALRIMTLPHGVKRDASGVWMVSGPHRLVGPHSALWHHNGLFVRELVERYKITHVLNASFRHFPTWHLENAVTGYDLVDDHTHICVKKNRPFVEEFVSRHVRDSDAVLTISHQLSREIHSRYGKAAHVVPNGANPVVLETQDEKALSLLRRSLGLSDKERVIGFIGNHGSWSGMQLLLESFEKLHGQHPDARLMVVGPGCEVDRLRSSGFPTGVVVTGAIPPERVHLYFQISDIGVVPFDLCPFTDNALPIKVLEFGFAKKIVLSTPLKELKEIALPHVRFAAPNAESWAAGMSEVLAAHWEAPWNAAVSRYDWDAVAGQALAILEDAGGSKA